MTIKPIPFDNSYTNSKQDLMFKTVDKLFEKTNELIKDYNAFKEKTIYDCPGCGERMTIVDEELEKKAPEFKEGMRVEAVKEAPGITKGMVYRVVNLAFEQSDLIRVVDDDGENSAALGFSFFKPYEKPKKGEEYWYIDGQFITDCDWCNTKADNIVWDHGLAFHTKEQASAALSRLKKIL
ncbi:MAG: hypothetical protein GY861_18510 [bacterium]|nr:hypothetical protein [bacterium]